MGVFDVGVGSETVGHGVTHVDAFPNLFDLHFKSCNAIRQIIDGINFTTAVVGLIVFRDLAGGSRRRESFGVAKVLGKMLFELAYSVVVFLDELR